MKTKASVLTLRLPFELKHKIEQIADEQGVSINQLALYTFTKEVGEIETYNYFEKYILSINIIATTTFLLFVN